MSIECGLVGIVFPVVVVVVLEPNSWFGLNKQDYWSWIEPLQDYYFNEKQNPLLRQVVDAISSSPKVHGNCAVIRLCGHFF